MGATLIDGGGGGGDGGGGGGNGDGDGDGGTGGDGGGNVAKKKGEKCKNCYSFLNGGIIGFQKALQTSAISHLKVAHLKEHLSLYLSLSLST